MKCYVIGLGCAKNGVDLEVILGNLFEGSVFEITTNFKEADLIWINTCAFIESAKVEAINTILEVLDKRRKRQKVVVSGCLSTRYLADLEKEIKEVDAFIPIKDYPRIPEIINGLFKGDYLTDQFDFEKRALTKNISSVYVKISEGCNRHCAYCAIPLIRGSFVSRDAQLIIEEVKDLVKKGAKEINLISQETTFYGADFKNGYNLISLLKDIENIEADFKIRLLYLYPTDIVKDLVYYIKDSKKVLPYFDIPLQHSEEEVLKKMLRPYKKDKNLEILNLIKKELPEATIRTTFIVGFPGETKEEFNNLLQFMKDIKFDRVGAFSYSKEEGTKGYQMKGQIRSDVKKSRLDRLYKVQEAISLEKNKNKLARHYNCLIEAYSKDDYCYIGRSYEYAPDDIDGVCFIYSQDELKIGEIYECEVIDYDTNSLMMKVV